MPYLVDTSVLVRAIQRGDRRRATAVRALMKLWRRRDTLCVIPQVVAEFWSVAVRPLGSNGLGYTPARAARYVDRYRAAFGLRYETDAVFEAWESLVRRLEIGGRQVHDARLVAAMLIHEIPCALTFDTAHFRRYPGIEVIHPDDVN